MPQKSKRRLNGGDVMTLSEAAAFLRVHTNTMMKLAQEKRVPHRRVGKKLWRFSRSALEKYMGAV